MKGILCACLLSSLQLTSPAQAYEADIHYSTTYVLARAIGWSQADALTIASANQGVDENQDTVAALEVDSGFASSLHQADKNLRFHCFSKTRGATGQISADVARVIARHFAQVPARGDDPRSSATRLIALGTALHCQQDAFSHIEFGGTCGSYSGSCYGHTYETFLDQVVFGLLKRHYFDPDHPGVSGERLLETLQGTASALAAYRPKTAARSIPTGKLAALSDALRKSGLELPDEVRRDCNRYLAGKWLHDYFQSAATEPGNPDALEKLSPEIARTCKNASLESATIVRIPAARFPRLNADASPNLVRADGTYRLLREAHLDASLPGRVPNYVQLSHWRQALALPLLTQVALVSDGRKAR